MKGISGGLNLGLSSTPKNCVQRWKPSVGGWTLGLSSTPKSCAQRWKVPVGVWSRMWVPVQPRKVGFRDESHQWGVEPRVLVQPPKSCVQRWKVYVGGWTGMWVLVQPWQGAEKNIAGSFRTQTPIQFLRGSFSKWFLSGSVPRGSRIPVRIDS